MKQLINQSIIKERDMTNCVSIETILNFITEKYRDNHLLYLLWMEQYPHI